MTFYTESVVPGSVTEKANPTNSSEILLMIPTLNEQDAMKLLLEEARALGFTNILVVDGFSTDKTCENATQAGARVILQEFGKGKGCGVRTGIKEFLAGSAQVLCIIDGDGTNDPLFLAQLILRIQSGNADVMLGSRTRGPREEGAMNTVSLASNLTVSFLLGAKFRRLFTDVQTGYWAFSRNAVQQIYPQIHSTGFEIELELFVKIMKLGLRVYETPVGFRRRMGHTKFSFKLRMRNLYYAFKFLTA
jgi:dolichol-phosphate mannosyltransferase